MARKRRDAILAFTDGACSGNPGPAGIGIVLVCGSHRKEISEYIGEATSNIAELTAIVRALSTVKDRDRHVIVHSDSEYAIGALTTAWKIRANKQLVAQGRALAATFPRLRFEWVPGHAGIAENERCDALARAAIQAARCAARPGLPAAVVQR
ncbi:MAG TPA: ribonuclease H [Kofleriaceae bacterium]|nr:ribonuclease H [Kofleriaceae bacterium]